MYMVNILPWRKRLKRRRRLLFWGMLAAQISLVAAFGAVQAYGLRQERSALSRRLADVDRRLHELAAAELRLPIPGAPADYRAIKDNNRHYLRIAAKLPQLLPPGLWLTGLSQRDGCLRLSGRGTAQDDFSLAHRRLAASPLFTALKWQEIIRQQDGSYLFKLDLYWPLHGGGDERN
ncbi:PilN domain-containing protein [Biostraticola tofi]|uniref:Pilus assembly protein HofN n=1 Tax=Biostraticola tofi TaxID=466109 RepID=A0A4R3YMV6_9GAMM|nr:PilN domain-containing protein [Biostraticola tofi]TCV93660.1 pilus assembly protein HofN [Biostraticola tofi]